MPIASLCPSVKRSRTKLKGQTDPKEKRTSMCAGVKCLLTSISRGDVVGANRSTTFPCLSTRNFAKFHLIESPNNPPFCSFKNLYRGEAFSPFTSILTSERKKKQVSKLRK